MNTLQSVFVGLLLAAVAVAGTNAFTDTGLMLLLGIGPVYFVVGTIAARRPETWRVEGSPWSGLFSGVTTWGVLMLLQGIGSEPRLDAAVLAFGLSTASLFCGALMVLDEGEDMELSAPTLSD